ncbi:MAG TPA: hypothetical protein VFE05_05365 [Longimicrobiaceae bacterium]|jgi:hypothetical protein|nr:hypothetical protein [Longimicrobiaceae bacterium]
MTFDRRRLMLGWSVVALALGAAACDSPTDPLTAPRPASRLVATGTMATATLDSAAVARDSTPVCSFTCTVWDSTPGVDTVVIRTPGGDSIRLREFGPQGQSKIVVGGDTFTLQVGVWDKGTTHGDFLGVLRKNGQVVGYWGHCSLVGGINAQWVETDPATGKKYVHWKNWATGGVDAGKTYHYIYDPQTNTLKIYYQGPGDTSGRLIYQGPPIGHATKIPSPVPAAGTWYTDESQYTSSGAAPGATAPGHAATTTPTTKTTSAGSTSVELASAEGMAAAA